MSLVYSLLSQTNCSNFKIKVCW